MVSSPLCKNGEQRRFQKSVELVPVRTPPAKQEEVLQERRNIAMNCLTDSMVLIE
jgi:hypothetical protein